MPARADVALARVRRVIAHGRRVADPNDPLGQEARGRLRATSGLSPEGIELALTRHIETDPTDEDLAALVRGSEPGDRCHVVLSAHVCTAAVRALALAFAAAPSVVVRPSRRDPVLAELLARTLAGDPELRAHDGSITTVADLHPRPGDLVHVYGADATIAAIRSAHPNAVVHGHGTGVGVAVVGEDRDPAQTAESIADDVVPFDQRGCLSPRWVLVEGGVRRAEEVAMRLHGALAARGVSVPRGSLDDETRTGIARHRAVIEAVGTWVAGNDHAVGLDPTPRALPLPPAARILHVVPADVRSGPALLGPWADFVTIVGGGAGRLGGALIELCPRARRAPLGSMQRPPLDGPVDRRPTRPERRTGLDREAPA